MNKLWAPWRLKYLTGLSKKTKGCVFCRICGKKNDKRNYVFLRSEHAFAVLNIYPYNNGHCLIVSKRHINDFSKLNREEKIDFIELIERTKSLLDKVLKPSGYNIGMNLGRVAGAGFPGHLHAHIVPRWQGDVNFMPIIGNTKIISQSLNSLYKALKKCAQEKKLKSLKKKR